MGVRVGYESVQSYRSTTKDTKKMKGELRLAVPLNTRIGSVSVVALSCSSHDPQPIRISPDLDLLNVYGDILTTMFML
jgi:hypothetical protein